MVKDAVKYNLSQEPLVISKSIIDLFLKEPSPGDLIAVYTYYYYTAKWQQTNCPKALNTYMQKGLGFGRDRFIRAKLKLLELGLIEEIIDRDEKKRIKGKYIHIKFMWGKDKVESLKNPENKVKKPSGGKPKIRFSYVKENPILGKPNLRKTKTNALSVNNINALSVNKEKTSTPSRSAKGDSSFSYDDYEEVLEEGNIRKKKASTEKQKERFDAIELKRFFEEKFKRPVPEKTIRDNRGREIDLNIEAGKRLLKKYGIDRIKRLIEIYFREKDKVPAKEKKYLMSIGTLFTFERKIEAIFNFVEKKGINWYTGKRVAIDETSKGPKKPTFQELVERERREMKNQ